MAEPTSKLILQLFLTAVSIQHQQAQARKLKRAQEQAAEEARLANATKNVRKTGSAVPLDFLYGYTAISPSLVNVNTSTNFDLANIASTNFGNLPTGNGSQNEYLILQKAIGFGELDSVIAVDVDDSNITDTDYYAYSRVEARLNGGYSLFADQNSSTINTDTLFHDIAYTTEIYKNNVDEPQFAGPPKTFLYLKGRKVRDIVRSGSPGSYTYSVGSTYAWDNNAIKVLLDYLLDTNVGVGLSSSTLDLESFYNAIQIADTVVQADAVIRGKIFNSTVTSTTRDIKKYEFNGVLSSASDHIENIKIIIDALPGAVFLRDATGKIKISLPDVENSYTDSELAVGTVTDDHLIVYPSIVFPDSSEKLNTVTITFPNASKDFANDTFTYAPSNLLSEDQNVKLSTSFNLQGISNKYHAEYLARTTVALSRLPTYEFRMTADGFLYEPGDIIRLISQSQSIDTYVRINSINIKPSMQVEIVATKFVQSVYTWTDQDDESFTNAVNFNFNIGIPNVLAIDFNTASRSTTISWTPSDTESHLVNRYEIERSVGNANNFSLLTTVDKTDTDTESFVDTSILTGGNYYYRVRARTLDNRRSSPAAYSVINIEELTSLSTRTDIAYADDIINSDTEAPTTFTFSATGSGNKAKEYAKSNFEEIVWFNKTVNLPSVAQPEIQVIKAKGTYHDTDSDQKSVVKNTFFGSHANDTHVPEYKNWIFSFDTDNVTGIAGDNWSLNLSFDTDGTTSSETPLYTWAFTLKYLGNKYWFWWGNNFSNGSYKYSSSLLTTHKENVKQFFIDWFSSGTVYTGYLNDSDNLQDSDSLQIIPLFDSDTNTFSLLDFSASDIGLTIFASLDSDIEAIDNRTEKVILSDTDSEGIGPSSGYEFENLVTAWSNFIDGKGATTLTFQPSESSNSVIDSELINEPSSITTEYYGYFGDSDYVNPGSELNIDTDTYVKWTNSTETLSIIWNGQTIISFDSEENSYGIRSQGYYTYNTLTYYWDFDNPFIGDGFGEDAYYRIRRSGYQSKTLNHTFSNNINATEQAEEFKIAIQNAFPNLAVSDVFDYIGDSKATEYIFDFNDAEVQLTWAYTFAADIFTTSLSEIRKMFPLTTRGDGRSTAYYSGDWRTGTREDDISTRNDDRNFDGDSQLSLLVDSDLYLANFEAFLKEACENSPPDPYGGSANKSLKQHGIYYIGNGKVKSLNRYSATTIFTTLLNTLQYSIGDSDERFPDGWLTTNTDYYEKYLGFNNYATSYDWFRIIPKVTTVETKNNYSSYFDEKPSVKITYPISGNTTSNFNFKTNGGNSTFNISQEINVEREGINPLTKLYIKSPANPFVGNDSEVYTFTATKNETLKSLLKRAAAGINKDTAIHENVVTAGINYLQFTRTTLNGVNGTSHRWGTKIDNFNGDSNIFLDSDDSDVTTSASYLGTDNYLYSNIVLTEQNDYNVNSIIDIRRGGAWSNPTNSVQELETAVWGADDVTFSDFNNKVLDQVKYRIENTYNPNVSSSERWNIVHDSDAETLTLTKSSNGYVPDSDIWNILVTRQGNHTFETTITQKGWDPSVDTVDYTITYPNGATLTKSANNYNDPILLLRSLENATNSQYTLYLDTEISAKTEFNSGPTYLRISSDTDERINTHISIQPTSKHFAAVQTRHIPLRTGLSYNASDNFESIYTLKYNGLQIGNTITGTISDSKDSVLRQVAYNVDSESYNNVNLNYNSQRYFSYAKSDSIYPYSYLDTEQLLREENLILTHNTNGATSDNFTVEVDHNRYYAPNDSDIYNFTHRNIWNGSSNVPTSYFDSTNLQIKSTGESPNSLLRVRSRTQIKDSVELSFKLAHKPLTGNAYYIGLSPFSETNTTGSPNHDFQITTSSLQSRIGTSNGVILVDQISNSEWDSEDIFKITYNKISKVVSFYKSDTLLGSGTLTTASGSDTDYEMYFVSNKSGDTDYIHTDFIHLRPLDYKGDLAVSINKTTGTTITDNIVINPIYPSGLYSNNTYQAATPASTSKYLGIHTVQYGDTEPAVSTSDTDYVFSKIKADDGVNGTNGAYGAGWYRLVTTGELDTPPTTSKINSWFKAASNLTTPAYGDRLVVETNNATSILSTRAYYWTGTSWNAFEHLVHGDMIVDGTIGADKIITTELVVGDANIAGNIQSLNYNSTDQTGWLLDRAGTLIAQNGVFNGTINSSSIYGGLITGTTIVGSQFISTNFLVLVDSEGPDTDSEQYAYANLNVYPWEQDTSVQVNVQYPINGGAYTNSGTFLSGLFRYHPYNANVPDDYDSDILDRYTRVQGAYNNQRMYLKAYYGIDHSNVSNAYLRSSDSWRHINLTLYLRKYDGTSEYIQIKVRGSRGTSKPRDVTYNINSTGTNPSDIVISHSGNSNLYGQITGTANYWLLKTNKTINGQSHDSGCYFELAFDYQGDGLFEGALSTSTWLVDPDESQYATRKYAEIALRDYSY